MARRPITPQFYEALLNAFRETPANYRTVGAKAGTTYETARKAWIRGWPERGFKAIEEVLDEEHLALRAKRHELNASTLKETMEAKAYADAALEASSIREKAELDAKALRDAAEDEANALREHAQASLTSAEGKLAGAEAKLAEAEKLAETKLAEASSAAELRIAQAEVEAKRRMADLLEKAKVDAAETMADEAVSAKLGRKAAVTAIAIATEVLQHGRELAKKLGALLKDPSTTLTVAQITRTLRELGWFAVRAEQCVMVALQIERLRLGEPTEPLGTTLVEETTLEEEETYAEAALAAIRREREKAAGGVPAVADPAPGGPNGVVH